MGIQKWSDNIILVNLANEPQMGEELQAVTDMVAKSKTFDVVVDFTGVDIVTSSSIAKLLELSKALAASDHRLVFSSASPRTKNVFDIIGLDGVFEFVDDQFIALAGLQLVD